MKHKLLYQYLNDDDLLRISGAIGEMEKISSGEIRVSIKEKKPFFKKSRPVEELARDEFFRLKMDKTRDKTGILIFLLLKEKQFHILADTGINEKVEQNTWDNIRDEMQEKFHSGEFCNGIVMGILKVGQVLSRYFPVKSDDKNELSNKVEI